MTLSKREGYDEAIADAHASFREIHASESQTMLRPLEWILLAYNEQRCGSLRAKFLKMSNRSPIAYAAL